MKFEKYLSEIIIREPYKMPPLGKDDGVGKRDKKSDVYKYDKAVAAAKEREEKEEAAKSTDTKAKPTGFSKDSYVSNISKVMGRLNDTGLVKLNNFAKNLEVLYAK